MSINGIFLRNDFITKSEGLENVLRAGRGGVGRGIRKRGRRGHLQNYTPKLMALFAICIFAKFFGVGNEFIFAFLFM